MDIAPQGKHFSVRIKMLPVIDEVEMVVKSLFNEDIIAENVDADTFMRDYADQHAEWINGVVIKMSPVTSTHNYITQFLITFFNYYLSRTKVGELRHEPFVLKLSEKIKREPDVFIVLNQNLDKLKPTMMEGAADLVIEVVSMDSIDRDRGQKFREYQAAGVREYWIIDPIHRETLFYTLAEDGFFNPNPPDEHRIYTSKVLPDLKLKASIFLQRPLPDGVEAVNMVNELLKK